MTTTSLPPKGRGISPNLSACRESQCNNHGNCVTPPGGGTDLLCNCDLGYKGDSCGETVNGALGLPLTLSVLAVLIGLAILAFVLAKYQQRKRKQRRYWHIAHDSVKTHVSRKAYFQHFPRFMNMCTWFLASLKSGVIEVTLHWGVLNRTIHNIVFWLLALNSTKTELFPNSYQTNFWSF